MFIYDLVKSNENIEFVAYEKIGKNRYELLNEFEGKLIKFDNENLKKICKQKAFLAPEDNVDYNEWKKVIEKKIKSGDTIIYFITYEEKPIGYFKLDVEKINGDNKILLDGLYIDEKFRHKHFGSSIIEFIIDISNQRKCKVIKLSVTSNNTPAIALYEKMGFINYYHSMVLELK